VGLDETLKLKDIEAPKISRQSAHEGGKVVSLMRLDSTLTIASFSLCLVLMSLHTTSYCRHAYKSDICKFTNLPSTIRSIRFLKLGYFESRLSFCILRVLSIQNENGST